MKKKLMTLSILGICLSTSLTGCFAGVQNQAAKDGGYFTKNKEDYVVINYSGNRIMDVWILPDTYVDNEKGSDGCSFIDNDGNSIILQGDVKIIRQNGSKDKNKYKEYHAEIDLIPYEEFINK